MSKVRDERKETNGLEMRGRGFAALLFCVALAVQLVAPAVGASGRFGASFPGCFAKAASQSPAADPKNAPTAPHHGTSDCQQCPPMAGGGVPLPQLAQAAVIRRGAPAPATFPGDSRALFSLPVLNDGAPPRAPPSRG